MPDKRIVFSTETPNDQGFVIPNDVIEFKRYLKNPVILCQHNWNAPPIGRMTDIKLEIGEWTGIPVFHRQTPESIQYADMWEAGFLEACSIGGFKQLETDNAGRTKLYNGIGKCEIFDLYEISMVSIPSNADAVAKLEALKPETYDQINLQTIENQITILSSKQQSMETEAEKATRLAAEAEATKQKDAADKLAADAEKAKLASLVLPPPIKGIVEGEGKKKSGLWGAFKAMLEAMGDDEPEEGILGAEPAPKDLPIEKAAKELIYTPEEKLPSIPNKLKAEKEEKLKKAKEEAEKDLESAKKAKEKAEKVDATDEDKEEFKAKKEKAEHSVKLCTELEADDDDDDEMAAKKKKEKSTQSSKIMLKTTAELEAERVKLAAPPQFNARIGIPAGTTLSKLKASKQGKDLIDRVQNAPVEHRNIQETGVYLNALRNEPKYKQVFDKVRIMQNVDEAKLNSYRQNSGSGGGFGIDRLIEKLAGGSCSVWDRDTNQMREATTLTATDNFLASPDLFAVDFLDLAIFQLFPTNSWKDEIAIFGAQETENNTGLIWANIAANPTIYMGNKPVVTDYQYTDTAVSLNLTPYWMQPMLWTPLTMHQLRYDQMSTGWAQAFAVMGTFIDDNLIYTLASTVPHSSIIYSSGVFPNPNGGQTGVQQFTLNGNGDDPNSFYYNPYFAGSLNQPSPNDIIRIEQLYNKQNYLLEKEKPVCVIDPTTDSLLSQSSQMQSLLTRWVGEDGKDLQKFKHSMLHQRSRVAAFDPTTAQVKNPNSAIPTTATGANLCFIPSQVAIGLGKLDVFMIQDPSSYGYRMSADVRIGTVPLRANFNGTALWAYGPQDIS